VKNQVQVFTFALLASSLVMLSAMPLFNNNAAFAQGYDTYGDSSYSQYPTDDKKYECRTGPFEGFFTSSVEFCKHVKFDDKKRDTKIGPPSPQGPAGVNFINNTNLYFVEGNRVTSNTNIPPPQSNATCDDGDIVIEGGYQTFVNSIQNIRVLIDRPFTNLVDGTLDNRYVVSILGGDTPYQAFAYCFDNPPLRP
jgi:hypothetical protein